MAVNCNCWQKGQKKEKSSLVLSCDYTWSVTTENNTQYASSYSCLIVFICCDWLDLWDIDAENFWKPIWLLDDTDDYGKW